MDNLPIGVSKLEQINETVRDGLESRTNNHEKEKEAAAPIPAYVGYHTLVECRYCYRKFNEEAIERHIGVCQNLREGSRPKPPPSKV